MKAVFSLILYFISFSLQARVCDLGSPAKTYRPEYARHFSIDYYQNFKVVHSDRENYLLTKTHLDCSFPSPAIHVPVQRVAMTSTTYLPALELLEQQKTLIAFQGRGYIVNKSFDLRSIQDISYKFNPEDLLGLKADLIMGYDSNFQGPNQRQIFRSLNLPVVINRDFEEKSPLARAEWMIFTSSFFDQEEKATKIFKQIKTDYLKLKNENLKLKKIDVIVGDIQGGFWMTCGGESDLAQMISDAGGSLAFFRPSPNTQKIGLEEVMQKKTNYAVWLTHNMWSSEKDRMEAIKQDSRYGFIRFSRAYNNNLIMNKDRASDYWETGMQRPDLLLKDLSAMFHPESFSGHTMHWYRKL